MDHAIESGFDSPSILHSRASLALEKNDYKVAIWYLTHAIKFTKDILKNPDVPKQDLVSIPRSYNQLALAYASSGQNNEALKAFNEGIELDPTNCDLMANLGNLYRSMNMYILSRETFQRCIDSRISSEWNILSDIPPNYISTPPPPAVFNNYGLLEMDHIGNYLKAKYLFKEALRLVSISEGKETNGYEVMLRNYNKVNQLLLKK